MVRVCEFYSFNFIYSLKTKYCFKINIYFYNLQIFNSLLLLTHRINFQFNCIYKFVIIEVYKKHNFSLYLK